MGLNGFAIETHGNVCEWNVMEVSENVFKNAWILGKYIEMIIGTIYNYYYVLFVSFKFLSSVSMIQSFCVICFDDTQFLYHLFLRYKVSVLFFSQMKHNPPGIT